VRLFHFCLGAPQNPGNYHPLQIPRTREIQPSTHDLKGGKVYSRGGAWRSSSSILVTFASWPEDGLLPSSAGALPRQAGRRSPFPIHVTHTSWSPRQRCPAKLAGGALSPSLALPHLGRTNGLRSTMSDALVQRPMAGASRLGLLLHKAAAEEAHGQRCVLATLLSSSDERSWGEISVCTARQISQILSLPFWKGSFWEEGICSTG
jgi:hypothetical protein